MRELTLEEMDLIAGGQDTGDVVVTGDPGPGDFGPGDFGPGDYGDFPSDGGGGGGGGGDSGQTNPPPVQVQDNHGDTITVEPHYDPQNHTADIVVTAANRIGDASFTFDLAKMDVSSMKLDFTIGDDKLTANVNLTNGMTTGTYTADFGDGRTGTISLATNGSDVSFTAGIDVHF